MLQFEIIFCKTILSFHEIFLMGDHRYCNDLYHLEPLRVSIVFFVKMTVSQDMELFSSYGFTPIRTKLLWAFWHIRATNFSMYLSGTAKLCGGGLHSCWLGKGSCRQWLKLWKSLLWENIGVLSSRIGWSYLEYECRRWQVIDIPVYSETGTIISE